MHVTYLGHANVAISLEPFVAMQKKGDEYIYVVIKNS